MKKLIALLAVIGMMAGSASASILVAWDVAGVGTETTLGSVFNTNGIQVSTISIDESTLNATATANAFNMNNWSQADSFAGAQADNSYFSFTVTPVAGWTMNISNIVWRHNRSTTGPQNLALTSSLDNHASILGSDVRTGTTVAERQYPFPGNLDPNDFEGLSSAVEFRIYGWNASGTAGTTRIQDGGNLGDGSTGFDFAVFGTAIPEPGTGIVMMLGFGFIAFLRRRMRA